MYRRRALCFARVYKGSFVFTSHLKSVGRHGAMTEGRSKTLPKCQVPVGKSVKHIIFRQLTPLTLMTIESEPLQLIIVNSPTEIQQTHDLLTELLAWDCEYSRSLGLDAVALLDYQYSGGDEILPGDYASPEGCLILATYEGTPAGCCAYRKLTSSICEIKRLYVRPEYRDKNIGKQLVAMMINNARIAGYGFIRLETVSFMQSGIAIYNRFGFKECLPYYSIPKKFDEVAIFM